MANASEAIQENFEELNQAKTDHDERLTTVEANTSLIDFSSSLTLTDGVTAVRAYKVGRIHLLAFSYQPTKTGFAYPVADIPSAYLPGIYIAGSVGTVASSSDAGLGIVANISPSGNVSIVTTTLPSGVMRFTFTWIT